VLRSATKVAARSDGTAATKQKNSWRQWHPGVISAVQERTGGFGELHRPKNMPKV